MATTALGLVVGVAWLNRRVVAREVLVGWLDDRGVPATVRVDRLELDGFVGRIVVGDPRDPDFSGDVSVDYRLTGPWTGAGFGVTPSRILLTRPVLKARWSDNRFSMGSLDPVIEEFTGRPPQPDSRSPLIIVQGGRLNLATDYGPVTAFADLTVDNGKLMRLKARTPDLRLAQGETQATGLAATLDLTTTGDRVALGLNLRAADLSGPVVSGRNARIGLIADLPYPDLKTRRGDGRASFDLSMTGDALGVGGVATSSPNARLTFSGQTTGWIETFRIAGDLTGTLRAAAVTGEGLSATAPNLGLTATRLDLSRQNAGDLTWSATGPATLTATRASAGELTLADLAVRSSTLAFGGRGAGFEATGPVVLTAATATFGDLNLTGLNGTADLDMIQGDQTLIQATGALKSSGGRWPLFGPIGPDDVPELAAMKAALGDFAVDLPSFRLSAGTLGTRIDLTAPARLTPRNGGVLTVLPVARPIFSAAPGELGGGALKVTATRGRGLPEATFDVPDWRLTPGGFSARLDGRARLDFGLAQGLDVTTSGTLSTDRGVLTYAAARCLDVVVERLELGENDVFDVAGQACPAGRPLAEVRDGRWRADLGLKAFSARAPFLALDVDRIEGTAAVTGSPSGIGLTADIASARVNDATTPRRFNPLSASGSATLSGESWTGGFDLVSGQTPIAHLDLTHDGLTGRGGVEIDTGTLTFAPGGLQPVDLTPLVAGIVSPPVTGSAAFKGQLAWDPALPEGISSGRLTVPGIDFTSPAGPVQGLRGTIDFTNLAPLTTAPGQILHVDKLVTITDLTDLDVNFALGKAAVTVSGAEIQVAGGFIRIEPLLLPLDRTTPFDGVIVFDRVQLGELVKGAGFDDKVALDAVVSGRLPFTYDPVAGVRIQAGTLAAVQPGRLSIQREALSGIEAGGGGAIPPGTVEDLAYQAMENLAFDTLSANVNSEGDGRVRLMFAIKGRHDPPERQELRLTIPELISRQFLNRPLPLPSDTGIDLNLNTTLNLNEVVGDLLAINRARNAAPATPSGTSPLP
ncbi:YdbH domain-containing protein [Brevundimonas sp. NIBR10]|uniref:intermembrane phospholipid transport protein YdbH family protein n=1 Tax=Brevundimonas sp. NIBR10 TaxID=3015997 RepID=UPI0022F1D325|nr:YdbH domain-containing protein [Brevundimonas sp. NIBR10]